jgi:hypothetical protein
VRVVLRFLVGSLLAILGSFPIAAMTALVFRFPIPFGGYESGLEAIVPSLYATVFYGMLGGFLVQGLLGGIAALIAAPNDKRGWFYTGTAAVAAAVPGVLLLSMLDWIIGPW